MDNLELQDFETNKDQERALLTGKPEDANGTPKDIDTTFEKTADMNNLKGNVDIRKVAPIVTSAEHVKSMSTKEQD